MLGLSFYRNTDQVLETLRSFSAALSETPYRVVPGFENELSKNDIPPTSTGTSLFEELPSQGWNECYLWDAELNRTGMSVLHDAAARPFHDNFSYGAALNRLMLLAGVAGASILVRIDPGTGSGPDFAGLLARHIGLIERNPGSVVSARYSGRPAIRDEFIAPDNRSEFYRLIYEYTGINPAPGFQLTGGAAFTMTADSPPAIPFDGVKVWGSDDGFFQVVEPAKAIVQREYVIERTEPGFGMDLTSYLERVANMAVLKTLYDGGAVTDGRSAAARFVDEVETIIAPAAVFNRAACLSNVRNTAMSVQRGYANYMELRRCWPDIQRTVRERLAASAARIFGENTSSGD